MLHLYKLSHHLHNITRINETNTGLVIAPHCTKSLRSVRAKSGLSNKTKGKLFACRVSQGRWQAGNQPLLFTSQS